MTAPAALLQLTGYPANWVAEAGVQLQRGSLRQSLLARHPEAHAVRTDRALYDYVAALKARHLRSAAPLAKVVYDHRLQLAHHALGTHTAVSRVQGTRLKAKREIRIASVFKDAPAALLRMIAVHELAHLKVREHDRAFYALCTHIEPDYHRLEFDLRLWLLALAVEPAPPARG